MTTAVNNVLENSDTSREASYMSTNPNPKTPDLNDPKQIAELGATIYNRLYKADYEKNHPGEYVAINISDESATLGASAAEALMSAKAKYPRGFFHLIRVGHPGAFEVGFAYRYVNPDRLHR